MSSPEPAPAGRTAPSWLFRLLGRIIAPWLAIRREPPGPFSAFHAGLAAAEIVALAATVGTAAENRTARRTEVRRTCRSMMGEMNSSALDMDSATPPTLSPMPASMQKIGR